MTFRQIFSPQLSEGKGNNEGRKLEGTGEQSASAQAEQGDRRRLMSGRGKPLPVYETSLPVLRGLKLSIDLFTVGRSWRKISFSQSLLPIPVFSDRK